LMITDYFPVYGCFVTFVVKTEFGTIYGLAEVGNFYTAF